MKLKYSTHDYVAFRPYNANTWAYRMVVKPDGPRNHQIKTNEVR